MKWSRANDAGPSMAGLYHSPTIRSTDRAASVPPLVDITGLSR
ncbi:MAG: hypothetical protein OJF47_003639 [Nitrospira sp.]|nr:MAG: hypothetical protein OJF47_003639 [Nitrospira sp.]